MSNRLAELNPAQQKAVTAPDGPVLVVAGAGSGKTRVLTSRVAWLLEERGLAPSEICAFTFTNKAARQMRERVDRLVGWGESPGWIGTFHAAGVRILRRDGRHLHIEPTFAIIDSDDSQRLIKQVSRELGIDPKQVTPAVARSVISRWKNDDQSPEQAKAAARGYVEECCARAYRAYEKALRASNCLDFDDLILRTVHLLEQHAEVRQTYAERFRHVLVDEFQDTNPLQLIMVKALSSHHGNIFVVGDEDQSIYSWRGACIENMLNFEEYFPGARQLRLEQNYRSTGRILEAANAVIANNRLRKGKSLWTEEPAGDRLHVAAAGDAEDEAACVAETIRQELARGLRRRDVTVLYRTNAQSRLLETALRRSRIPYQLVGSVQFYERREVRDILAYLKLIANPRDEVSALRVLNVPRRRIGAATIKRLLEIARAEGLSLGETAGRPGLLETALSAAAAGRVRGFFERIALWRVEATGMAVPELIEKIVTETGYLAHLESDDPATAKDRAENLSELVNAGHDFHEASDGGSLLQFLEQVALVSDIDGYDEEQGSVRLMTIHTAKGLEFPVVILVGCEEDLLPHLSSLGEQASEEEERRLFYVALTRARRRVHLLHAHRRRRFGEYGSCLPSRFLSEIPDEVTVCEQSESTLGRGRPGAWRGPAVGRPDLGRWTQPPGRPQVGDKEAAASLWTHEVSQEEVRFSVGQRVVHARFGCGVVARVEGSGGDLYVSVDFADVGRKHLLARLADLRPVD